VKKNYEGRSDGVVGEICANVFLIKKASAGKSQGKVEKTWAGN